MDIMLKSFDIGFVARHAQFVVVDVLGIGDLWHGHP
jgi:hypothetical protein